MVGQQGRVVCRAQSWARVHGSVFGYTQTMSIKVLSRFDAPASF